MGRQPINSLIGRLIRSGDIYRVPEGVLSSAEVAALRHLTGAHAADIVPAAQMATLPKPIELNLSAQTSKGPNEQYLRICLDFGTAMSKAWATGQASGEAIPLVLGKSTGDGSSLVVPSSIYIGRSGQIYFGSDADKMFRQEVVPGRLKFENIKRLLSEAEVGSDLYSIPLNPGIDPTDSGLHRGDLLLLYLAWLTDHTLRVLSDATSIKKLPGVEHETIRYVRRRFAIPCFEHAVDEEIGGLERAKWAHTQMQNAIVLSQIVADTLSGQWAGLTAQAGPKRHPWPA